VPRRSRYHHPEQHRSQDHRAGDEQVFLRRGWNRRLRHSHKHAADTLDEKLLPVNSGSSGQWVSLRLIHYLFLLFSSLGERRSSAGTTAIWYRSLRPEESAPMETLNCTTMHAAIASLFLAASAKGLVALEFDARLPGQQSIRPNPRHIREENLHNQNARTKSANNKDAVTFEHSPTQMRPYITELEEYFRGHLRNFTLPLDLRGTQFQQSCWQALQAIPYGETRSYAQIARAIG